jgi:hypothetical protein
MIAAGLGVAIILATAFLNLGEFWLAVGAGLSLGTALTQVSSALRRRLPSGRVEEQIRWIPIPLVLLGLWAQNPFVVFSSWTVFGLLQLDYMILRRRQVR